jgi:hypothetical protein
VSESATRIGPFIVKQGAKMYIGVGTIIVILLIIIVLMALRRGRV